MKIDNTLLKIATLGRRIEDLWTDIGQDCQDQEVAFQKCKTVEEFYNADPLAMFSIINDAYFLIGWLRKKFEEHTHLQGLDKHSFLDTLEPGFSFTKKLDGKWVITEIAHPDNVFTMNFGETSISFFYRWIAEGEQP